MSKSIYRVLEKLINTKVKGADIFKHNGSTWLIFENDKRWVIELTKDGTLWYNFYFFQDIFELVGLDEMVNNQHHITKWVEDTIINGVKDTRLHPNLPTQMVEDTIQNGVKDTLSAELVSVHIVEDAIQNGVNYTGSNTRDESHQVEDAIQNGVRNTFYVLSHELGFVENTIQNGVKYIQGIRAKANISIENTIQNGVKRTELGGKDRKIYEIKDIVENGVKYTLSAIISERSLEDTIQNGVKHTIGWAKNLIDSVEDTIQNGVKETGSEINITEGEIDDIIQDGIKLTTTNLPLSKDDGQITEIEDVITNGIKETKSPGADGDLLSTIEWMESNNIKSVPEMIDDVITNGIKETKKLEHDRKTYHGYFSQERGTHTPLDTVQDVLKNGVKETQPHVLRIYNPMNFEPVFKEDKRMNEVDDVLGNGIREIQPLPAQDGNRDWGKYYHGKEDRTKPFNEYLNDVIENGIKENPSF